MAYIETKSDKYYYKFIGFEDEKIDHRNRNWSNYIYLKINSIYSEDDLSKYKYCDNFRYIPFDYFCLWRGHFKRLFISTFQQQYIKKYKEMKLK